MSSDQKLANDYVEEFNSFKSSKEAIQYDELIKVISSNFKDLLSKQKIMCDYILSSSSSLIDNNDKGIKLEFSKLVIKSNLVDKEETINNESVKVIKESILKTLDDVDKFISLVVSAHRLTINKIDPNSLKQVENLNETVLAVNKKIFIFLNYHIGFIKTRIIGVVDEKHLKDLKELVKLMEMSIVNINIKSHKYQEIETIGLNDELRYITASRELQNKILKLNSDQIKELTELQRSYNHLHFENIQVSKDVMIDSKSWFNLGSNSSKGLINLIIKIKNLCDIGVKEDILIMSLCDDYLLILNGKLTKKDLEHLSDLMRTDKFLTCKEYLTRFIVEFEQSRVMSINSSVPIDKLGDKL